MKAAVLEALNRMVVREVPDPTLPDENSLILRVESCAVCGSDIRIYHHGNPRVTPPQVIGHEVAGRVVAVGSAVTRFKVGDRLATGADVPCGECRWCRDGLANNCAINYAIGYQFPGGFAEYMPLNATTVRYGAVHHIPATLSYDEATLAEPLACCINGLELARVALGDTVVVIGAGPAGLHAHAPGAQLWRDARAGRAALAAARRGSAAPGRRRRGTVSGGRRPGGPGAPRHGRRGRRCGDHRQLLGRDPRPGRADGAQPGSRELFRRPAQGIAARGCGYQPRALQRACCSPARTAACRASIAWRWTCWRPGSSGPRTISRTPFPWTRSEKRLRRPRGTWG